ncbi:hypothetical protein WGM54_18790 [Paenibacillus polymyxa]
MQKSAKRLIAKIAGIFVLPPLLIIGLIIWVGNILDSLTPTIKHGEFPFE